MLTKIILISFLALVLTGCTAKISELKEQVQNKGVEQEEVGEEAKKEPTDMSLEEIEQELEEMDDPEVEADLEAIDKEL
ncbi:MAG TPA: hypothetical protein VMW29_00055 [Candidatus Bathyarchaeia archaeon]|nr:hypothetical protein [Candidatus Bathyarchaeia archaeon]